MVVFCARDGDATESVRRGQNSITVTISQFLPENPGAVLIGHLNCDGPSFSTSSPGECTKTIIEKYYGRCPIFVNFGNSQLELGYDFWKDVLPRVSMMQFNLSEARQFFTEAARDTSLEALVDFLMKEGMTSVITIDRFGAIGSYKDGRNGIILAWPLIDMEQICDPTGAGDAFAAGMVSQSKSRIDFTFQEFHASIEVGRTWAAFACTTLGGSSGTPDQIALNRFLEKRNSNAWRPIEIHSRSSAEQIMRLIDTARR
jgi:sugar/nucleoside kinase (ribokinase family)